MSQGDSRIGQELSFLQGEREVQILLAQQKKKSVRLELASFYSYRLSSIFL